MFAKNGLCQTVAKADLPGRYRSRPLPRKGSSSVIRMSKRGRCKAHRTPLRVCSAIRLLLLVEDLSEQLSCHSLPTMFTIMHSVLFRQSLAPADISQPVIRHRSRPQIGRSTTWNSLVKSVIQIDDSQLRRHSELMVGSGGGDEGGEVSRQELRIGVSPS